MNPRFKNFPSSKDPLFWINPPRFHNHVNKPRKKNLLLVESPAMTGASGSL